MIVTGTAMMAWILYKWRSDGEFYFELNRSIYIWDMILPKFVTKAPLGNDLGNHAKPLLFTLKASHGLWTVIDKWEYDFAH